MEAPTIKPIDYKIGDTIRTKTFDYPVNFFTCRKGLGWALPNKMDKYDIPFIKIVDSHIAANYYYTGPGIICFLENPGNVIIVKVKITKVGFKSVHASVIEGFTLDEPLVFEQARDYFNLPNDVNKLYRLLLKSGYSLSVIKENKE